MILAPAGATTVIGAAAGAPATFCIRTCAGTGTGTEDGDVGALMVRSTPSSCDARARPRPAFNELFTDRRLVIRKRRKGGNQIHTS